MITTKQYDEALARLKELNKLNTVPGDREEMEKQYLSDLLTQYEDEHDAECRAEQELMDRFE